MMAMKWQFVDGVLRMDCCRWSWAHAFVFNGLAVIFGMCADDAHLFMSDVLSLPVRYNSNAEAKHAVLELFDLKPEDEGEWELP